MKRIILITLFCFFILTNGEAQSYFSKRIDVAGKMNSALSFLFYKDTFYIPNFNIETSPFVYSLALLKISKNGMSEFPTNQ